MAAGAEGLTGRGWDAALAAALIGTGRAPPALPETIFPDLDPGGEAGARLLARLAAHGLHRLAGAARTADALAPLPPRAADGPPCPPAAAERLGRLLAAGPSARARLAEWCALAAAAGVRAPAWLLPALAPYRRDIAALDAVAGPELDWLARAFGEAEEAPPERRDWQDGTPPERRAAFAAFRARDPEGARAALETGFKAEKAAVREILVAALEVGLAPTDAPFLEACLDDRAAGVRAAAQRLLPRLPGSPLSARMAVQAGTALAVESRRRLLRAPVQALVVTLPEESPALARDGIALNAHEQGGARTGMLRDILAAAPLSAFAEHPPRLWIEGALRSDFAEPIVEGFLRAIARERDPVWLRDTAAVLAEAHAGRIDGVRRTGALREAWARAVTLLPPDAWEAAVHAAIRGGETATILAVLDRGPDALSGSFSAAVLDWLARIARGGRSDRRDLAGSRLLDRLGDRLAPDADHAAAAAAIPAQLPYDDGGDRLRDPFARLAETLALRAAMRREFASHSTAGETARG